MSYQLVTFFWRHAFEVVILPQARLKNWGHHPRVITKVKQELSDRGIILRVRKHNRIAHQAGEYRINPSLVTEIYPATTFFFSDFKRACRGIYRPHQLIQVSDPEVKASLKDSPFYWDGQKALEILFDPQVVPHDKRQTMWSLICSVPTSDQVKANWRQSAKTGRLSAWRPPVQNTPKAFRRPGVISLPDGELHQIDFVAQHAQICLALNGKPTIPDLWDVLGEDSGAPKDFAKAVVNPFLAGQQKGGFLWKRRVEGLYAESDQEDYDRIMEKLKALGVKGTPGNRLMLIASEILGAALPLMQRQGVKMVIPLHDGVIITGDSRDVGNTREAFYRASENVLGVALPVESQPLF